MSIHETAAFLYQQQQKQTFYYKDLQTSSFSMKARRRSPRALFSPYIWRKMHNLSIFDFDIIGRNILASPTDSQTFTCY